MKKLLAVLFAAVMMAGLATGSNQSNQSNASGKNKVVVLFDQLVERINQVNTVADRDELSQYIDNGFEQDLMKAFMDEYGFDPNQNEITPELEKNLEDFQKIIDSQQSRVQQAVEKAAMRVVQRENGNKK